MPDRPNLVFVFSDQQRYDTLRCYGNDWIQTPQRKVLCSVEQTSTPSQRKVLCSVELTSPSRCAHLPVRQS